MEQIQKHYSFRGSLTQKQRIATFDSATPWKDANIAFNWINFEYPLIHEHADWEILLITQGQILHTINGNSDLLTVGTGCLIGPSDKHAISYPDNKKNDFQGVSIIVRDSYLRTFLQLYTPTLYDDLLHSKNTLYFSISHNSIEKYTNLLLSAQDYSRKEYCQQQCNIVFTYLILKIIEQQISPITIPSEIKDFVRQLNNPSITREEVQKLQNSLPYSYSQLTRIFKKHLHCTITQYINQVKMNYAKELLSSTEMSIAQIASELQFESGAHFHILFKKMFKITPLNYRKNATP